MKIHLDVHAHLIAADGAVLSQFDGVSWDAAAQKLVVDGHAIGLKSLFRPADLVDWMDENGIERAWISAPPPVYRPRLAAPEAARWTAALNRELDAIARRHPTRLSPLFHLTAEHPDIAFEVARESIKTGHRRFAMAAGGAQHILSAPAYEPLWQVLNEASAFLAHAGGTAAALAGRWQRGHATARPGLDVSIEPPSLALRRFCVDCIAHDKDALELAAQVFGEDHIVFGSDWPFPMGLPQPHRQLGDLRSGFRQRIFCDNPQRLTGRD